MRWIIVLTLLSVPMIVTADKAKKADINKVAVTCFYKSEQVSGMNKICYYDCLGSAAAITISAVSLCPLNITR